MSTLFLAIALFGFAALLLATVIADLGSRTIPDRIPLAILGLTPFLALGLPDFDIVGGLLCGAAMFAFGLLAFRAGWLGGGDVKLMTAIAVWAGPPHLLPFLIETALAGGLVTLGLLAPRLVRAADGRAARTPDTAALTVPYGVAIAAAGTGLLLRLARDGFPAVPLGV